MKTVKKWTIILSVCFGIGVFLGISFYNAAVTEKEKELENRKKVVEEWKSIEEKPIKVYKAHKEGKVTVLHK